MSGGRTGAGDLPAPADLVIDAQVSARELRVRVVSETTVEHWATPGLDGGHMSQRHHLPQRVHPGSRYSNVLARFQLVTRLLPRSQS